MNSFLRKYETKILIKFLKCVCELDFDVKFNLIYYEPWFTFFLQCKLTMQLKKINSGVLFKDWMTIINIFLCKLFKIYPNCEIVYKAGPMNSKIPRFWPLLNYMWMNRFTKHLLLAVKKIFFFRIWGLQVGFWILNPGWPQLQGD